MVIDDLLFGKNANLWGLVIEKIVNSDWPLGIEAHVNTTQALFKKKNYQKKKK